MRILLFLATNIAVMVLVSLVFNLLGLEGILSTNGVDLNLSSLLIFCALFGFLGSFVSLLASKVHGQARHQGSHYRDAS